MSASLRRDCQEYSDAGGVEQSPAHCCSPCGERVCWAFKPSENCRAVMFVALGDETKFESQLSEKFSLRINVLTN
ncbi:MAG TPA: hypothetical protein VK892_20075 [Pyrinomonadaceae bacterium]|nr:hypothetical protein [Pyrinomonadaceae bacterium]